MDNISPDAALDTYLRSLFSLRGKIALVTGGAKGLGWSISKALVGAGARVFVASRDGDACAKAATELDALAGAGSCRALTGDVANEAGVDGLAQAFSAESDQLHILINNAGRTWGAPLESFPYDAWQRVLGLNVAGAFHLTRQLLPLLARSASDADPSRVINLGSVAGALPIGDGAYSYAASKAAVHHLTRILAKELAPRNINVNALAPGAFESRMTAFALEDEQRRRRVEAGIPLRRLGNADDLAAAVLYLCGHGGAYVTGAIMPIDGGVGVDCGDDLWDSAPN